MNKKRTLNDSLFYSRLKKKYKENRPSIEQIHTITLAKLYSAQNLISNKETQQNNTNLRSLKCDDCDQLIIFTPDTLLNSDDYFCTICHHIVCDICKISTRQCYLLS
ncbi:hypothetical protein PMAC_002494 [Pneumocystis sp. 'macacae']|nr:hypothetical protein PMAC_002494 [Pneumocystis sp. 'macacae']